MNIRQLKLTAIEGSGWHPSSSSCPPPKLRVIEGGGERVEPPEALRTDDLMEEVRQAIADGRYFEFRNPDWREKRFCNASDVNLFFKEDPEIQEQVKAELCTPCEVRRICLTDAIEEGEPSGVCGCADLEQRRQIAVFIRDLMGRDIAEF